MMVYVKVFLPRLAIFVIRHTVLLVKKFVDALESKLFGENRSISTG